MLTIGNLTSINLGWQGENNSRTVQVDVSAWLEQWPGATISLLVQRPGEDEFYPADAKVKNGIFTWTLSRSDLAIDGEGKAQMVLTGPDGLEMRSRVVKTVVGDSIDGTEGDAPAPLESWVHDVLEAAENARNAVDVKTGGLYIIKAENGKMDRSYEDVVRALSDEKVCLLVDNIGRVFTYQSRYYDYIKFRLTDYGIPSGGDYNAVLVHDMNVKQDGTVMSLTYAPATTPNPRALTINHGDTVTAYDGKKAVSVTIPKPAEMPDVLPNPHPIKLTGAVNATYDGSSAVTVEIPQGGSGGGSTSKVVTILSATTLTLEDPDAGTYVLLSPFETKPEGGMLCTVTYNGTDYQCPAEVFDKGQGAVVAMGNFALIGQEGGNAEAPFVLMCAPDGTEGMYAMMMATDSPFSVTVGITAKVVDEAIRAYVDGKVSDALSAIPEPTTDVLTVTADVYNLEVSNMSHTYAEIVEAIKAGKAVQLVVNQGEDVASYALPLILWQDSSSAQYAMFQRIFVTGESTGGENVALTVTVNGKTGQNTAEYMDLPYMTRAQVVELINEMTGNNA